MHFKNIKYNITLKMSIKNITSKKLYLMYQQSYAQQHKKSTH